MTAIDDRIEAPDHVMVDGERVTIPVEVRSAKMVAATFLVDAEATQSLIDHTGLRAVSQRGRAVCALSAVQYSDNDLGPYNELAVAFVVEPHDASTGGSSAGGWSSMAAGSVTTFIHRLPVNQEFTCHAGRQIWGFPKWVADITCTERGRRHDCVLIDEGELVLSLSITLGPIPVPAKPTEMSCYSWSDGALRRTSWITDPVSMSGRPGGAVLELGHGHPMADELRSLGLPKRALMTMSTPVMRATFGPPERLT
jgi:hypothetical protein